ncbi:fibrinogen-like protein A [Anopheles darlingi]|uniref:fibrinogen-like protein A n=1 Tax=Anopheles darlingi TaxID=43151 RepID=UPI0021002776|nr:fibrinogen-like protein A [Anopheles darlingi]
MEYLGHHVDECGVKPLKESVSNIANLKPPTTVREVRFVLETVNFYAKFIPGVAHMRKPLSDMRKKGGKFVWTEKCQQSFDSLKAALPDTSTTISKPSQPASCKEVSSNVSGVYEIRVSNSNASFEVYCEQKKFGGGWIVVQYRFNGSVDFYRNWDEYRDGFGNLDSEFWLGLEKMHQLTKSRTYELIVELKDFSGTYKYTRYNAFEIDSETEQYKLKTLGSWISGNAGDTMTYYNKGMKFSTKDRDNDGSSKTHCAQGREGAWWYGDCTYANLNGKYSNSIDMKSMFWYFFNVDYTGLSFSRMMIREF